MRAFLLLAIWTAPIIAAGKDVSISMIYSNAIDQQLPLDVIKKDHWEANPKARFVKLHVYLDEATDLGRVEIDSCDTPFDALSVFGNFDERYVYADPKVPILSSKVHSYVKDKTTILDLSAAPLATRSLTFNFEKNRGVKVCGLRLYGVDQKLLKVSVPELVEGTVVASSTLKPSSAYGPLSLFDSRFEYGWATNGLSTGASLNFTFAKSERMDKMRIWSGYQRSLTHCQENARPKVIRFQADDGTDFLLPCKDSLGSQILEFPKTINVRSLTLTVQEAYPGNTYKDLVISEMRFGFQDKWFSLDPMPKFRIDIERNRADFERAGLGKILDDGYFSEGFYTDGKWKASEFDESASLRLRSDGSFYIQASAPGNKFFALGNYEVKDAKAGKPLSLKIFGLVHWTAVYGDCNGCGRDCNKSSPDDDAATGTQRIFSAYVTLSSNSDGSLQFRKEKGSRIISSLDFLRQDDEVSEISNRHNRIRP
jgi:hypothetical protein